MKNTYLILLSGCLAMFISSYSIAIPDACDVLQTKLNNLKGHNHAQAYYHIMTTPSFSAGNHTYSHAHHIGFDPGTTYINGRVRIAEKSYVPNGLICRMEIPLMSDPTPEMTSDFNVIS